MINPHPQGLSKVFNTPPFLEGRAVCFDWLGWQGNTVTARGRQSHPTFSIHEFGFEETFHQQLEGAKISFPCFLAAKLKGLVQKGSSILASLTRFSKYTEDLPTFRSRKQVLLWWKTAGRKNHFEFESEIKVDHSRIMKEGNSPSQATYFGNFHKAFEQENQRPVREVPVDLWLNGREPDSPFRLRKFDL